MIFASKKDLLPTCIAWAGCILTAGPLVLLVLPIPANGMPILAPLFATLPLALWCLLVMWPLFATSYEITATEIVVRFGPICRRVLLASVTSVESTRQMFRPGENLLWSLDRVLIAYRKRSGRGSWLPLAISPQDQAGFLARLAEVVPNLRNPAAAIC